MKGFAIFDEYCRLQIGRYISVKKAEDLIIISKMS